MIPLTESQQEAIEYLKDKHRIVYRDAIGSGKTRVAIELAKLHKVDNKPILVIGTSSALTTWVREIPKWHPGATFAVYTNLKDVPAKMVANSSSPDYILVTYYIAQYGIEFWYNQLGGVICDEAHKIPLRGSKGFGNLKYVLGRKETSHLWLLLITASPTRNSLKELWRFYHILDKANFSTFYGWEGQYFDKVDNIWNPHARSEEVMLDAKVAFKKEFDTHTFKSSFKPRTDGLYEVTGITIELGLTKEEKWAYDNIRDVGLVKLQSGELQIADGPLAILAALRKTSLHCEAKVQYTKDWVDSHDEQYIIVSTSPAFLKNFIPTTKGTVEHLDTYEIISGEVSTSKRSEIVSKFQAGELRGIGLSVECAESMTLTNARLLLMADYPFTPEAYRQAIGRIDRLGQTRDIKIYHLVATATDEYLLERMLEKDVRLSEVNARKSLYDILPNL